MIFDTFGGVHDFFHSSTWYVIRNLGIFFVIVFWVATIYWVYKDARRRIDDTLIVGVVTLIATRSSNERALPAEELATLARTRFETVETQALPADALARAHALGRQTLVTGSLYLLADLAGLE